MANSSPAVIYLMSRRDRKGPFGIRSRAFIASFSERPDKQLERAQKYMHEQRTSWQGCEPTTEFRICVSGDKIEGFEDGLPQC